MDDRFTISTEDLDYVAERTADVWPTLAGDVLLTGATGFFGIWLTETFLWAKQRFGFDGNLIALSRSPYEAVRRLPHLSKHRAITWHKCDVRHAEPPPAAYVLHAGCPSVGRDDAGNPLLTWDTIVGGTRRMLEYAVDCQAKRFLFVSSGIAGMDVSPDDHGTVYAQAKRSAEHLCALYRSQYGLPSVSARCFTFIGPYLPLNANYAVGNFIRDGLAGGPIVVHGDGGSIRSHLYAADLAATLWKLLLGGETGIIEVGRAKWLTTQDLANCVADAIEPRPGILIQGGPDAGVRSFIPAWPYDSENQIGVSEAIKRTIKWHKERG